MPTELRRIVFTNSELHEALDANLAHGTAKFPSASLDSVRFVDDRENEIVVTTSVGGDTVETVLGTARVAAALIKFCMATGVRLPRAAKKSISLSGDNLALDLRIAFFAKAPPPAKME
jgi:hypothetical protein